MILCPHCHGASGSVDHEWCRTCKGTGALNQPCDRCGYRVASVAVGDGVYLCDVCAELTEESEGMEDEEGMNLTLAIDPGASGGVAWKDGNGIYSCEPMPPTPGDVCDLLRGIVAVGRVRCYMEKVNGYMGNASPGSAMFRFGQGVGYIEGCLAAWGVSLIEVPPQRWIKALGLGIRGELGKAAWKRKLQAEAQRRFPQLKVTLKTADALLILAAMEEMA